MKITELIFGEDYAEVHAWLDATFPKWFKSNQSPFNHWVERHHMMAILEKYLNEPDKRAVAFLHVICDIASRWHEYYFPTNADEVRAFLKNKGIVVIA